MSHQTTRVFGFLALILLSFVTNFAAAVPPSQVARLSYILGNVSFLPAGIEEWVTAMRNRPLTIGDRLWLDEKARVELQLGTATAYLAEKTSFLVLNMDDSATQFQITEGRLNLRLDKISEKENYEIDTPNLALTLRKDGKYKIEVDQQGNTTVTIFEGEGDVYGGAAYHLTDKKAYRFIGKDLKNYSIMPSQTDDFDNWSFEEREPKQTESTQYVSPQVIGYADLDGYGEWQLIQPYGYVWMPTRMPAQWRPYYYGHWAWIDPWGWTWIDQETWGFAVTHYGRWVSVAKQWYWVPGPRNVQPVYAPALVVFFSANPNTVAWLPLSHNEFYWPPYSSNRDYFIKVNTSNTTINTTQITQIYNNSTVEQNHMNAQVADAITAVSTSNFAGSQPVNKSAETISDSASILHKTPTSTTAPVIPQAASIIGGSESTKTVPAKSILERSTIVTKPPSNVVPFAEKEKLLTETKGKPLTEEQLKGLEDKAKPQPSERPKETTTPVEVTTPSKPPMPEVNSLTKPRPEPTPERKQPVEAVSPAAPKIGVPSLPPVQIQVPIVVPPHPPMVTPPRPAPVMAPHQPAPAAEPQSIYKQEERKPSDNEVKR